MSTRELPDPAAMGRQITRKMPRSSHVTVIPRDRDHHQCPARAADYYEVHIYPVAIWPPSVFDDIKTAIRGHVEEDMMAQEAAAKNSGPKARPTAAKPVSQTVQDALRRLAVVEHMTYPAEVNGQMNVRLEGIMSARQLEALRKWLA